MANPGQPTISVGATGDAVKRLQRALRRTPDLGITVNGVFDSQLEAAVKDFQSSAGLVVDGMGPLTWNALPDGGPMPTLERGSSGDVVRSLQTVLTNGASGQWVTTPRELMATSALTPKHRSKHFKHGEVLLPMESLVTKPGRFRCMR